jgi:hypothetical protein
MQDEDNRAHPIPEDMGFQRHEWIAERIGWVVMAVAIAAALAGLFASGPLSEANVRTPDNAISVDFQRFAHKTSRTHFTIRVSPPAAREAASEVLIRLGQPFVRTYDVEALSPRPLRSTAGSYGLEWVFVPSPAGDLVVQIAGRAKRFGISPTEIQVEGRGAVSFTQIIYP